MVVLIKTRVPVRRHAPILRHDLQLIYCLLTAAVIPVERSCDGIRLSRAEMGMRITGFRIAAHVLSVSGFHQRKSEFPEHY